MTKAVQTKMGKGEEVTFPLVAIDQAGAVSVGGNLACERYLNEIGQYELLCREEMEDLAIQVVERQDRDAAVRLITANLRLVVKVARDFQRFWMQNFMDLVQEGNVGLLKAVRKFDPYKGVKFSYYAIYWIRASILKFLMNNWRLVKIGTTEAQRRLFFSLNRERKALEVQGVTAEIEVLARRLNVKRSDIEEMDNRLGNEEVSLESPVSCDSASQQKDLFASDRPEIEEVLCRRDMKKRVKRLLDEMREGYSDKERVILEKRLLSDDPLTLQKISEIYGVSRERIRQIESRLLRKMRGYIEKNDPEVRQFVGQSPSRRRAPAKILVAGRH